MALLLDSKRLIIRLLLSSSLLVVAAGCHMQADSKVGLVVPSELSDQVTPPDQRQYQNITLGEQDFKVELANTPAKIELGLSYRQSIGAEGMLFVLPRQMVASFWMKGMVIPLDIVWINCDDQCRIVDLTKNIQPPKNPTQTIGLDTVQPVAPVNYVLEVPAGFIDQHQITWETAVRLSP